MKSSSMFISLRIDLEFWKLIVVDCVISGLVSGFGFNGLSKLLESQSSAMSCSWLRSIRLGWLLIGVGTHIDVFRDEFEGDWVIIRAGDFWISFKSFDSIDGVVDGAGERMGSSFLCCCWTSELDEVFLLKFDWFAKPGDTRSRLLASVHSLFIKLKLFTCVYC